MSFTNRNTNAMQEVWEHLTRKHVHVNFTLASKYGKKMKMTEYTHFVLVGYKNLAFNIIREIWGSTTNPDCYRLYETRDTRPLYKT